MHTIHKSIQKSQDSKIFHCISVAISSYETYFEVYYYSIIAWYHTWLTAKGIPGNHTPKIQFSLVTPLEHTMKKTDIFGITSVFPYLSSLSLCLSHFHYLSFVVGRSTRFIKTPTFTEINLPCHQKNPKKARPSPDLPSVLKDALASTSPSARVTGGRIITCVSSIWQPAKTRRWKSYSRDAVVSIPVISPEYLL